MKRVATAPELSHLNTRHRLLEVAARQIAERGFEGTNVRAIADAAGVTSGAIYRHFPGGKDELYLECLKFVAETIQRSVAENLRPSEDPIEVIVQQWARTWDFFAAHPSFAALLLREGISGNRDSPYFAQNVASMAVLKAFMAEAARCGKIRKVSPAHFLFSLGSYCLSYHGAPAMRASIWQADDDRAARRQFLAHVRDLLAPR